MSDTRELHNPCAVTWPTGVWTARAWLVRAWLVRAWLLGACLLAGLCGCSRSTSSTTATAPLAAAPPAFALPPAPTDSGGNLTAGSSETIATNVADPNCPDCQRPDATSAPRAKTPPLDPAFVDDVKLTVVMTCKTLEDGVAILEKHTSKPEQAEAALKAYREKNKTRMAEMAQKTVAITTQLKALGFVDDMPPEVKPDFEERMGKILTRLEAVRGVYVKHPAVLEAFGPFIPSGQ